MADFDFMLFIIKVYDVEKGLMFILENFKTIWVITKANWMKRVQRVMTKFDFMANRIEAKVN